MRRIRFAFPAALVALLLVFGACGGNGTSTVIEPKETYTATVIYDHSAQPYDVAVQTSLTGSVDSVKIGRNTAEKNQYKYENGTLAISGEFMAKQNPGEKEIEVKSGSATKRIPVIIATKVIKTADDLRSINADKASLEGVYVLGNDIDLAGAQFEPLGWYYSETDARNAYFHGVFDGNGYTIKNAHVWYTDDPTTNQKVYNGAGLFTNEAHKNGDNIGFFQVIGSAGVVRNTRFEGISVIGRTICGVIAGNCMGRIENCVVDSSCSVTMSTHFYDYDCNAGGVVGIVAGGGTVSNTISLTKNVKIPNEYKDYGDDYIGKSGDGWDHPNTMPGMNDPTWKFAAVDKDDPNGGKMLDSNNSQSNGIYGFAGKIWGETVNCYCLVWQQTPYQGSTRNVFFGQTHKAGIKDESGADDMGTMTGCAALNSLADGDYSSYDPEVWNLSGTPALRCPVYQKA